MATAPATTAPPTITTPGEILDAVEDVLDQEHVIEAGFQAPTQLGGDLGWIKDTLGTLPGKVDGVARQVSALTAIPDDLRSVLSAATLSIVPRGDGGQVRDTLSGITSAMAAQMDIIALRVGVPLGGLLAEMRKVPQLLTSVPDVLLQPLAGPLGVVPFDKMAEIVAQVTQYLPDLTTELRLSAEARRILVLASAGASVVTALLGFVKEAFPISLGAALGVDTDIVKLTPAILGLISTALDVVIAAIGAVLALAEPA